MPDAFYRLLAVPNSIAMIGLGISLWRATTARPETAVTVPAARRAPHTERGASAPPVSQR